MRNVLYQGGSIKDRFIKAYRSIVEFGYIAIVGPSPRRLNKKKEPKQKHDRKNQGTNQENLDEPGMSYDYKD